MKRNRKCGCALCASVADSLEEGEASQLIGMEDEDSNHICSHDYDEKAPDRRKGGKQ